jgi:hypothetical protein
MVIGSVLVQPQKMRRVAATDADAVLLHDFIDLTVRLLEDAQSGGQILALLVEVFEGASARMQQRVTGGFGTAEQRLRAWMQPLVDGFRGLGDSALRVDGTADGLDLGQQVLVRLSLLAQGLTLDQLRVHVALLLDILQTDLGVTRSFIEDQIWVLIDDVIVVLEQDAPDLEAAARENRLEIAAIFRRLRLRFRDSFEFPEFDAEHIARLLLDLLRGTGFDAIMQRAACTTDRLGTVLSTGADLARLVPFSGSVGGSVVVGGGGGGGGGGPIPAAPVEPLFFRSLGAAAANGTDTYAWYATWLLQYKTIRLFGLDDIKDVKRLVQSLKNPASPLATFLREQLGEDTRQSLADLSDDAEPTEPQRLALLADLNRVLRGRSIHTEPRFVGVTLHEDTRELLREQPQGEELVRLNRMLLEDALPDALKQLSRGFFGKAGAGLEHWFLKTIGWPGEKVWVNRERTLILHGDKPLLRGTDLDWTKAPFFDRSGHPEEERFYIFEHISPGFADGWARHTSWIADAVHLIWHLTQIAPRHQVPPILNATYDLTHGIVKLAAERPFSGFHFFSHKWLDWQPTIPLLSWGAPSVLTTLGSIQGRHSEASFVNQLAFWFTVLLGDLIKQMGPLAATRALRDGSLTVITLVNFGGPRDGPSTLPERPAENHNEIDGIVNLAVTGVSFWLASLVDRQDYVNPTRMPGKVAAIWLAGGLGMGLLGGLIGTIVAQILAWAEDWKQLGLTMLKSVPSVWVNFWPLLYSVREGDTDGGRFNPAGGPFLGYPTKVDANGNPTPSPYRLPYAADTTLICGQGNAGMWSHNVIFNPTPAQTYAYDFAHDAAEEILACRAGTVVDFFEWVPDDTAPDQAVAPPAGVVLTPGQTGTGTWNFITIRHDVDDNGNLITPDPAHDRDVNGNPAVTFAVYGHGRQNGVTAAFARWATPVPTANIIGTRVRRGQPIMLAGDTGTSFHNHLHMHVLAETRPGGAPTAPATNAVQNTAYTIPFIFEDVGGDGVCKANTWYTSNNMRRLA